MTETTLMEPVLIVREQREPLKNQTATIILEAVDESLSSFGESFKQVIYSQLLKNYHVERHKIPSRIEVFASAIEGIFGSGAALIEMKIMEKLYSRAKGFLYIPKEENLAFKDYVLAISCFLEDSVTG